MHSCFVGSHVASRRRLGSPGPWLATLAFRAHDMTAPRRTELSRVLPAGDSPLSRRLRVETKELHAAAERSGIMKRIARGQVSRPEYVALLENLSEIYRPLEEALRRHHRNPALSWLDLDALSRLGALAHDIAALRHAGDAVDTIRPATRTYVERIRDAEATQPELLLAHAYVRYLGDLSGGQVLAPIVACTLGDEGARAVAFYQFPMIADPAAFKQSFRDALDGAASGTLSDRIVGEAKIAFVLHEALFRELQRP